MADKIAGYFQVGINDKGEVVINLERDLVGHIAFFTPEQADHLAFLLQRKANEARKTLDYDPYTCQKCGGPKVHYRTKGLRCPHCD